MLGNDLTQVAVVCCCGARRRVVGLCTAANMHGSEVDQPPLVIDLRWYQINARRQSSTPSLGHASIAYRWFTPAS